MHGSLGLGLVEVRQARERITPHLQPTPLRHYEAVCATVGHGIHVLIKHENHQPTQSFKVRNAFSALTALSTQDAAAGVVAASRGNHGAGLAYAGQALGLAVTVCVPDGNNPEKTEGMLALGARVLTCGRDYDDAIDAAARLQVEQGLTLVHSSNHPDVLCGAATMTLEMLEQAPQLDALVLSVGGGSQAAGAIMVARELCPRLRIYAVQSSAAPANHAGFHARAPMTVPVRPTMADGLATRSTYGLTFPIMQQGLSDFVLVTDQELAWAMRLLMRVTHNLVEPAGAAGLAGLCKLATRLEGQTVGVVISGGNVDAVTLQQVLAGGHVG